MYMALGSCCIFFFQTHFWSVTNSKDFQCVMMRATQKEQTTTTHDFEKKIIDIFQMFYQLKLRLSFLDWAPKCGDNIHHTVLSSATVPNLSLSIEHLLWIRFRRSAKLSDFHLLCASILVFFSIFKLIVFSMLNENFFVTCKVKMHTKVFKFGCR